MKKTGILIFIAALLIGLTGSFACRVGGFKNIGNSIQGSGSLKTETRNVSGFKKIKAENAVSVDIAPKKDFGITVEADDNLLQYIKTDVDGDVLKIYFDRGVSPKTTVRVTVAMPEIDSLDVSGASTANLTDASAKELSLTASGASKIKVSGSTNKLDAEASGASKIEAENLKAQIVEVEASGASGATVNAVEEIKAEASGASSIRYTGDPQKVEENASGASSIKRK